MEYTIFHNDHPVCAVSLEDDYSVKKIEEIYDKDRMPPGLTGHINIVTFNDWFFGRAIPEKRSGLDIILETRNVKNNKELTVKNFGLGLSDHYWIKSEREEKTWRAVNFFENEFKTDGDDIFLAQYDNNKVLKDITPNVTSSGMLPKKWIVKDGSRYLMKGSESMMNQEPFNEKIVSDFLEMLNIDHVRYDLVNYKNNAYSLCKNMLTAENELIQAYYVEKSIKRDNKISNLDHYINCCAMFGLKKDVIRNELEEMIVVDYLTANTDRHWGNFGILRNAETLSVEKLAPLYDNGASFYTKYWHLDILHENRNLMCRSFKTRQEDVIKLVSDFAWIQEDEIKRLPDMAKTILSKNEKLGNERLHYIYRGIEERINMLNNHIKNRYAKKASRSR
jgi:hypothetical protein